jgi:hypothetical protein
VNNPKVVVKGITGLENIYYEVRLFHSGRNILVNTICERDVDNKKKAQALGNDLFNFLSALNKDVELLDYCDLTRTTKVLELPEITAGVEADDGQKQRCTTWRSAFTKTQYITEQLEQELAEKRKAAEKEVTA